MILEPLQFLLPHREPAETLPADTELNLPEEPVEVLRDSEKTEQLEDAEQKQEEDEEKETTYEEFSLE